jgi:hypothetical protein
MELGKLKTDAEKTRGTWVKMDATCQLKLTYTNTTEFKKARADRLKPYRNVIMKTKDFDSIPPGEQESITVGLLVDFVVLDWKGLTLKGANVPYSKEKAREILKEFPEFREMVEEAASDISNFREEETKEEEEKNSATVSVGS